MRRPILVITLLLFAASVNSMPASLGARLAQDYPDWSFPTPDANVAEYFNTDPALIGKDPNYVEADFDGDGLLDYAMQIKTAASLASGVAIVVVYFARSTSYLQMELGESDLSINTYESQGYIGLAPQGEEIFDLETQQRIILSRDSLAYVLYDQAGSIYQFPKSEGFGWKSPQRFIISD